MSYNIRVLNLYENRCLIESMLDEDPQMALRDPKKIDSSFDRAYTIAQDIDKESSIELEDPFDYISAEH
ncbi:MAG TPA: hypothetical protein ENH23_00815, partial [candidate division Zixibacteria bacterium]|nr:hypothetical protein [candidate division Zixibacteria bacterium]